MSEVLILKGLLGKGAVNRNTHDGSSFFFSFFLKSIFY